MGGLVLSRQQPEAGEAGICLVMVQRIYIARRNTRASASGAVYVLPSRPQDSILRTSRDVCLFAAVGVRLLRRGRSRVTARANVACGEAWPVGRQSRYGLALMLCNIYHMTI